MSPTPVTSQSGPATTGGLPSQAPEASPTEISLDYWTAPPDPLDLEVVTDDTRTVEAVVDAGGDTLVATGSDGTTYTLTIPKGTLWLPALVSVTPLTSISGRGKTAGPGNLFGVQLEPSGLELFPEATLRIEPAMSLDEQGFVYFGYHGRGEDAGLEVPDLREPGHVLSLDHFSGAGIVSRQGPAGGADDESGMIEVLVEQVTSRLAEDRLNHAAARRLERERERQLFGAEASDGAAVEVSESWEASYFRDVIEPRLRIAAHPAATCEQATAVIQALFGAERQRALLGAADDEGSVSAIRSAYDAAARQAGPLVEQACRRDAARECKKTGDPIDVVRKGIVEAKAKALIEGASDVELEAVQEAYEAILQWCAVYELTFRSTTRIVAPNYTVTSGIEGSLKMRLVDASQPRAFGVDIEGQTASALNPMLMTVTCTSKPKGMTCAPGATGMQPTRARTVDFMLKKTSNSGVGGTQVTLGQDRLTLQFGPSPMMLPFIVEDADGIVEIYATPFLIAHEKDKIGPYITVKDWQRVGHPTMFRKTYTGNGTKETTAYFDTTVFELIHKPDPEPPQP